MHCCACLTQQTLACGIAGSNHARVQKQYGRKTGVSGTEGFPCGNLGGKLKFTAWEKMRSFKHCVTCVFSTQKQCFRRCLIR